MKKNVLLLIGSVLFFGACTKELTRSTESNLVAPTPKLTALAPQEKEQLLSSIAADPKFTDYLKSLIALQNYYQEQLTKNKNFDFAKSKQLPKPNTEAEWISGLKSVGFVDPETYLAKNKEAMAKWTEISNRYPLFTSSFTDTEKKAFFRKHVDLLMGKNEK